MHNKPTVMVCYTMQGPVPAAKIALRCTVCMTNYRYDQYMVVRRKDIVTMNANSCTFEQAILPMWNGCVMSSGLPWGKLIII